MTLSEQINEYISVLGCTAKELSEASGLSPAVISRYRSGTRTPNAESGNLEALAQGLSTIASRVGNTEITKESVLSRFAELSKAYGFDFDAFSEKLNSLLDTAEINLSKLAQATNFDASYISRIRSGQRRPADPFALADVVSSFVAQEREGERYVERISTLIGMSAEKCEGTASFAEGIREWLCSGKASPSDRVGHFLQTLDSFNLDDYVRNIHFDELKVPSVPFCKTKTRSYYGLEEMKAAELEFLKGTVLGKSMKPVLMFTDMDMADSGADEDFKNKYMLGIALMLKKGLQLNVIHDINRPYEELMMGLEGWIPMYMTGQISPYYLSKHSNDYFRQMLNVSGSVALSGECIAGHHDTGMNYVTGKSEELFYYEGRAAELLELAAPLMEIYSGDRIAEFNKLYSPNALDSLAAVESDKFSNIKFYVKRGQYVIIRKSKAPEIYFVVRQPMLRKAIEDFLG